MCVGRVVLHLTHDALVKLGQVMANVEGVLGQHGVVLLSLHFRIRRLRRAQPVEFGPLD